MSALTNESIDEFKDGILHHLNVSLGAEPDSASNQDWRAALSLAIREKLVGPWLASERRTREASGKRVYYLSMEFLMGRLLEDAAVNLGIDQLVRAAIESLGLDYSQVVSDEPDAALGNGGLGRLAACFLDSLSTLGIPSIGYGIRYEHGLFRQEFNAGIQIEHAEDWLDRRPMWEFERPETAYQISFGGYVHTQGTKSVWHPGQTISAVAYDMPVVGWKGRWANTLRLWSARPVELFDLDRFNKADYLGASEAESLARTISRQLYPDDSTEQGKELRLKQEYFFTAASVQDIVRRFMHEHGDITRLPEKVAIQLNDTHPAIAGPELIRLLVDEHGMALDTAIETAQSCLSYTNHTLLPEALERWPEALMARVLPRHHRIIEQIDDWHQKNTSSTTRIVEGEQVKMGELAFITSHRVNGVSALHTELVQQTLFTDLDKAYPGRIVNQTNGITPRRWLYSCNQPLRELISSTIGDAWPADLAQLTNLTKYADDEAFLNSFSAAKRKNKENLADWVRQKYRVDINPDSMFDVQIKRIHEYKRQLMNLLETVAYWNAIHDNPTAEWTPRVKIFGGKAAPGYVVAKQIIRLINDVAAVINADSVTRDKLQVFFPENYNVSMAERLIPAANLSEQISTAGMEASGTGNMKLSLNGALTIGTLDGANVEIRECVGPENFFLFGLTAEQVLAQRNKPDYSREAIEASPRLTRVLNQIRTGLFSPGEKDRYVDLVQHLFDHDYFLVTSDFDAYFDKQREVDVAYRDQDSWTRMALLNAANVGWFSSDRTIAGYAKDIWRVESGLDNR